MRLISRDIPFLFLRSLAFSRPSIDSQFSLRTARSNSFVISTKEIRCLFHGRNRRTRQWEDLWHLVILELNRSIPQKQERNCSHRVPGSSNDIKFADHENDTRDDSTISFGSSAVRFCRIFLVGAALHYIYASVFSLITGRRRDVCYGVSLVRGTKIKRTVVLSVRALRWQF